MSAAIKTDIRTFDIYSLDMWGNPEEGWDCNERHHIGWVTLDLTEMDGFQTYAERNDYIADCLAEQRDAVQLNVSFAIEEISSDDNHIAFELTQVGGDNDGMPLAHIEWCQN